MWKTWFLNPPPGLDDHSTLQSCKIWFCDGCLLQGCVFHLVWNKIFSYYQLFPKKNPTCKRDHGLWHPPSYRGQSHDCHTGKTVLCCLHMSASGRLETRLHRWGCPRYCGTPDIIQHVEDNSYSVQLSTLFSSLPEVTSQTQTSNPSSGPQTASLVLSGDQAM